MWRKGWMMKISEVKQWEARAREEESDCEWSRCSDTNFVKRLRCAQCRWGVRLLESEEGELRTWPVMAVRGKRGEAKAVGGGWVRLRVVALL